MAFPFRVDIKYIRAFICFCSVLNDEPPLIEEKLQHLFGDDAPKKSCIYKWINAIDNGITSFDDAPRSGRPVVHQDLPSLINEMITDEPFHSTRTIAAHLNVSRETVRDILVNHLQLRKFKCKWIPYPLTEIRKQNRIHSATLLLPILQDPDQMQITITGDQAWFYLHNPHKAQWADSSSKVTIHAKKTIQSKKVMVTILWGIGGFYLVEQLPSDQSFNSLYFVTLLQKLKKKLSQTKAMKKIKQFNIHLDNAKVHRSHYTMEKADELGFHMLPHPPYSPDLAPSDFFLFGYIKHHLQGYDFHSPEHLMMKIHEIIRNIPADMLESVMVEWIQRLSSVASSDGSYVEE